MLVNSPQLSDIRNKVNVKFEQLGLCIWFSSNFSNIDMSLASSLMANTIMGASLAVLLTEKGRSDNAQAVDHINTSY